MSDYSEETPVEEYTDEEVIEGDRDIPSVSGKSNVQTILGGIFLATCLGAIIYVAMQGISQTKEETLLTDAQPEEFRTSRASAGKPFINPVTPASVERIVEEKKPTERVGPQYDPAQARRKAMLEKEALRLAQEQQDLMAKRMVSPQLIVGNSGNNGYSGNGGTRHTVGVAQNTYQPPAAPQINTYVEDENSAFRSEIQSRTAETVLASRIENISYTVPEGTLISGVMESAISTNLPGEVRAVVSQNVYSLDQSQILIPKGARLIGKYNSAVTRGQNRVFVIWTRLIRADGIAISLNSTGTDALGRAGSSGFVDTHFDEQFSAAIILSIIEGAIEAASENDDGVTISTGGDSKRAAEIALEQSVGTQPTIYIDQGTRIKIFVNQDLDFANVIP